MEIWFSVADGGLAGIFLLAAVWTAWIYRHDGSETSFLWTALLALTASGVLACGAVAITRTGAVAYPVTLASRDLLQGVSALIAVRALASFVPRLKVERLMQATIVVILGHACLWAFTSQIVVKPLHPGTWPTYGRLWWVPILYGIPPLVAAVMAAVRGTRRLRRVLAGIGVLALTPAVGAAFASSHFVIEECTDLSTAAIGFGLLGLAVQRMNGIVKRRDVLLQQRAGLAELAQLAVDTPDVEPVRVVAERLLRSQLDDNGINVVIDESTETTESSAVRIVGRRKTVSADLGARGSQERSFAEQTLRVVASAVHRALAEDEVRHTATHHSLTGLPNRMLFLDRLEGQLESNGETVVVLCGLRGLDDLAATQGHSVRDDALVAVSQVLSAASSADRVLSYLGGGTFGLIVTVAEHASEAAVTAQLADLLKRLHVAVSTDPAAAGRLRAALGTALGRGMTAEELLRDATAALSRAVEQGRSFAVYNDDLGHRLRRSADTSAQLQHALARDEIEVHYQPVVDTNTRQVTSFEALARWRQDATIIGPALWIPTAEATGLIHDIGMHVLAVAARDQSRLNANVGINVSPVQIAADDFADRAIAALGDCPPSAIILEVTENAIMADVDHAIGQLQKLRGAGIRIALDDFGTSYSSLSVLSDLPLDIVKIDRSFIQRMDSPAGVAIVEAIVAMARALGKSTVAEGVETAEQFSALAALGIDRIQGFHVAQPMISIHAERWPRARPLPAAGGETGLVALAR